MAWSCEIELGNWTETIVSGEVIRAIVWTTVFANKKSVRQSEFYEGMNAGLKPELTFEVRTFEFDNHEKARFNGKTYDITRTYSSPKTPDITELNLSAPTGGAV